MKPLKYIKLILKRRLWRFNNRHNKTAIMNDVEISQISVGVGSYGLLDIKHWGNPEERLVIGNYVSIANGVTFILGGNHYISGHSTYPLSAMRGFDRKRDALSKGAIILGDDVWIGANVTILSGVIIGRGAIIAAGSVVTKNINEYEIVGGNPAKFLKMRLSQEERYYAKMIDFSKLQIKNISQEDIEFFYSPPSELTIKKLKKYWT